jgi:hypothetical protein
MCVFLILSVIVAAKHLSKVDWDRKTFVASAGVVEKLKTCIVWIGFQHDLLLVRDVFAL